ncbi:WcbI family polysaccharide biosynthesis putative acetyltransferase [Williamsia sterculiae]|uniref:Polysaccharide biosynthesis enzyme WcbI domain-containing protein n=1 Tax=Williamsia sterculiae TaxID=1344003 RepID=A0A1N7EPP7_9NOCA|nr:WcbI family polysaccharide biosynthesis putative acetyltransferase [Williamsia sterculiae]SIR90009.1 hypothetical protein SAMN05445060_1535 [Williamsia sterculiae]
MTDIDPRTRHFGSFYRLDQPRRDERPLWVIWGNCQAEALRVLLASAPDVGIRTVRVPPVHELEAGDIPFVRELLADTQVLLSQPVRDGYRELPIGTADAIAMMPVTSRVVRWPVVRYAGLHPFQIIVRDPADMSSNPPVVPYHDLRTVLCARDAVRDRRIYDSTVDAHTIREVAQWSVEQLHARERRDTDIAVSDVLSALGASAAHTINHPGNAVLMILAQRMFAALDVPARPVEPDRDLLGSVRAPLDGRVVDALNLDARESSTWTVDGAVIPDDEVFARQIGWYADHPGFFAATERRYAELLEIIGIR